MVRNLRRGDQVLIPEYRATGTILGPEDIERYDYNNPSKITGSGTWALVQANEFDDMAWFPATALEPLGVNDAS